MITVKKDLTTNIISTMTPVPLKIQNARCKWSDQFFQWQRAQFFSTMGGPGCNYQNSLYLMEIWNMEEILKMHDFFRPKPSIYHEKIYFFEI